LHGWQSNVSATNQGVQLTAFDLAGAGSLSSWFSSLILLAASVAALAVYTIRRHKTDDYHGRYRIWLWAALCWFLAATDVAANLHESLKLIMIHLTKTNIGGNGSLWWILPYGLVFGAVGSRLVLDMRQCKLSTTIFLMAAAGYLATAYLELGIAMIGDQAQAIMIKAGVAMFSHLMLLLSMMLSARYVILDAEGLISHSVTKQSKESDKKKTKVASTVADNKMTRIDSSNDTPQPLLRHAASTASTSSTTAQSVYSSSYTPPEDSSQKLSKQEKKALRDRLMRERLERERKQHSWK
jgi:hypothetical protein